MVRLAARVNDVGFDQVIDDPERKYPSDCVEKVLAVDTCTHTHTHTHFSISLSS